MNWVRNNRFLAVFLAIVLVGVGTLGYLLYSSLGRYQQVDSDYKTQVDELKRLQGLEPYPDAQSQTKYDEVRKEYTAAVTGFQADLASHDVPPSGPPPTPIQFQDRLRQVVSEVSGLAQQSGVALPEGFYLGFEQYRGSPPDTAATPMLNVQLDNISNLVTLLIKTRIDKLNSIKRAPLPQESGAAATPAPGPGRPGVNNAPVAPELVSKQVLEIAFTTLPGSFRDSLNSIVKDKRLYIIRALEVKNQVDKGPPRDVDAALPGGSGTPPASPPPTAPGPNGEPNPSLPEKGPPPLRYIVGQEKLDVVARIELAKVAPPAAARPCARFPRSLILPTSSRLP